MSPQDLFSDCRAVLFDVDGTLVDTLEMVITGLGDSYEHFLGTRPATEALAGMMGVPLREQMLFWGLDQRTEETVEDRIDYTIERYMVHRHTQKVYEPTLEAFLLCRERGIKTALVTSRNTREVHELLIDFPVFKQAESFVCSSDVEKPKPAADSALLACRRLFVQPEHAIFLGDSIYDMGCGRAAGMPTIAVTYGAGKRDALIESNPDLMIETPEQLLETFKNYIPVCEEPLNQNFQTSTP
ncbi:MAG: HAD hydrolase-like protein [Armatimonadetes bacterium]|nr:HAD hydrolase-like protein [Armatimonadota bacterium]